jgi:hypothetical protein
VCLRGAGPRQSPTCPARIIVPPPLGWGCVESVWLCFAFSRAELVHFWSLFTRSRPHYIEEDRTLTKIGFERNFPWGRFPTCPARKIVPPLLGWRCDQSVWLCFAFSRYRGSCTFGLSLLSRPTILREDGTLTKIGFERNFPWGRCHCPDRKIVPPLLRWGCVPICLALFRIELVHFLVRSRSATP